MYGKTHNNITYNGIIDFEAPSLSQDESGNVINIVTDENLANGKLSLQSSDEVLVQASKDDNKITVKYKLNNSANYIRYEDIKMHYNAQNEIMAAVLNINKKSYYLLGNTLYNDLQTCIDNQKNFVTQSTLEGYKYVTEDSLEGKKYLTNEEANTLISDSVQTATNSLTARLTNMESSYISLSNTITSLENRIKTLEGKAK